MADLDTHDLDSLIGATYFVVGRGTEGGQSSYKLNIAGVTSSTWGNLDRVKANSGYSLGTIQVDLGQRGTWALGATTGAPLERGERSYVDAIIHQASTYAEENGLAFTQDHTRLHADLLSHGDGKGHHGTLTFIDKDTRDGINAWASSEDGQKWIHKNIDYPQVRHATQEALEVLDRVGKHISDDHRLETIAILAKTANQMPGRMADFETVMKNGGDYADVLAKANEIRERYSYYAGPKAAAIAKQYKQAHDDPMAAAAIDRAHAKVGGANFNPLKSATDSDIEQALKAIGQGHRSRITLHQGSQGTEVISLQTELARLGFTDAHGYALKPDGDFGPITRYAVETFQRDHGLEPDGKVGHDTREALEHATLQQSALATMVLDSPHHPGFSLFQQAFNGVSQLDQAQDRPTDLFCHNLSGALALAARKGGLERIDRVLLSNDASRAFAVQNDTPLRRFVNVDVVTGINTPLARSSAEWMHCGAPSVQGVQAPALPVAEMTTAHQPSM